MPYMRSALTITELYDLTEHSYQRTRGMLLIAANGRIR